MLKVESSTSASDYASNMIAYSQSNMDSLAKVATSRQKDGQSSVSGHFLFYTDYDKTTNRMITTEHVPAGLKKTTGKGGTFHMKNAEILLTTITPTPEVTLNDDGTYTVVANVKVDAKSADSVLEYLRQNNVEQYYDSETDSVRQSISFTVSPNMPYSTKIMTFAEADLKPLSEMDTRTGKLKIRKGKSIKLQGAQFGIYLKTYQKNTRNGEDEEPVTVFSDEFSISCSKMELDDAVDQSNETTMSTIYDSLYPKDQQVLFDIKDVIHGNAVIPSKCHFYTSATKIVRPESGLLVRISDFIKDRGSVLRNYDKDQYETKIQARFTCTDIYPNLKQTFIVQFTAYEESCASTGLDVYDHDLWGDLMNSHVFTAHFVCQYSENATRSLTINQLPVVNLREQQENYTHGTYVFSVKQWVMDWKDTLEKRAIRITKDRFLQTFKDANAGLSSGEKKFKVATVDGNDELVFTSILPGSNPIMNDGIYSKVINFGSGARPTFNCPDASPILNHEGAQFYALTGIKTEDTTAWSTPEEGDKVFSDQLEQHNVKYQLFVVQNLDDIQKKINK